MRSLKSEASVADDVRGGYTSCMPLVVGLHAYGTWERMAVDRISRIATPRHNHNVSNMKVNGTPNIYVVGAQCTGKTTIVKNLEDYFSKTGNLPPVITEVARTVLATHDFTAADVTNPSRSLELQRLILHAQLNAERTALAESPWFISDRSGADPIVYAMRYVGESGAASLVESNEWTGLRLRMQASLIIVCEAAEAAGTWIVDDGVRLIPSDVDDWVEFHRQFCAFLTEQDIDHVVLPVAIGSHQDRVKFVIERWEGMGAGP